MEHLRVRADKACVRGVEKGDTATGTKRERGGGAGSLGSAEGLGTGHRRKLGSDLTWVSPQMLFFALLNHAPSLIFVCLRSKKYVPIFFSRESAQREFCSFSILFQAC